VLRRLMSLTLFGWLACAAPTLAQTHGFADWAVIVVAGDWRAESGEPSKVFDNARKDLSQAFVQAGFSPGNIRQFSVHEAGWGGAFKSDPDTIQAQLEDLTRTATGGCLLYFTSHGSPDGVVIDDRVWQPGPVTALVTDSCGARPTVVVISACFSGQFVEPLSAPNRMVLTAARPDRTSFGCGQEDHYTFFDDCVLASMPGAHDFADLARATQACVARKEAGLYVSEPSEPQLDIGPVLRTTLPLYAFAKPAAPLSREARAP
jgi:hypothetical protein